MSTDVPLPDADHLPIGDLVHRIRALDADGVRRLLDHETGHANRPAVVQALRARAQELADGVEPSGGDPSARSAAQPPPAEAGPAASPATAGPPQNPPSHGDPTNPAQPRR
jgi:hypothetical protein